jgi:phospholipid/cholesterol/gamma-HCH transport system substrate-binding protein
MNVQRYVKIGLFFLSLGVSGTAYVILAGDGFSAWNTKEYEVLLDDATGLSINSKVFMAGVPVGKIQEISLDEGRAVLRVAFLKDVEIRGDARISRQASSLLGTSILALNPGTPETPILREGGRVESASAGGDFRTTLTAANDLSAQIGAILAEFQERHMVLLAASLETINSLGTKLDQRSAAELDRVSRILESAALIAERFEQVTRDREGDIDASVLEVRSALENIREITEAVKRGDGNLGRAFADDELYESLLSTAKKAPNR